MDGFGRSGRERVNDFLTLLMPTEKLLTRAGFVLTPLGTLGTDALPVELTSYWERCAHYFKLIAWIFFLINSFPPRWPDLSQNHPSVILLCLMPDDFTHQGRGSGRQGLTECICPPLVLNPSPPRTAKTAPLIILLYLTNTRQFYLLKGATILDITG